MNPALKSTKRMLLNIGVGLLCFLGIVAFYFSTAFVLSHIAVDKEPESGQDIEVYLITNGVHVDLVLPIQNAIKDWREEFPIAQTSGNDSTHKWLALGWGDRGFYLETPTWADLKFSTAFKAVFGLSRTAVHATFYHNIKTGKDSQKLLLSKAQYLRLIAFIKESLRYDNGRTQWIQTNANYGDNDAFYEAKGKYSMFKTCNTWVNSALKCSGQRAVIWTVFGSGIFYVYQNVES